MRNVCIWFGTCKDRRMNLSRSFAVLFYYVPNLIIRFGTCKVRRLNQALIYEGHNLLYHPVIESIFLLQGKNDTTYLVDKMFVTSIIRTRIKCEKLNYPAKNFF